MASITLYKEELRNPDTLPRLCMKCGAPAVTTVRRNFSWIPPWVIITILAGLLPYIIIALIFRKSAVVHVPFCAAHTWHWLKRSLIGWLGFLALIAAGIAFLVIGSNLNPQQANDYGFLLFMAWFGLLLVLIIIVSVLQTTAIRPTEITDKSVTLVRVAPQFCAAVEAASAQGSPPEVVPVGGRLPSGPDTKACPHCGQQIKQSAVKCRFCGQFLSPSPER
jgi:hypothetical protein